MKRIQFTASISSVCVQNKEEAKANIGLIWRTMQPYIITLAGLKRTILNGQPFLCCKRKQEWNKQQLFCLDVDQGSNISFKKLVACLDYFQFPPCMAYTTYTNPPGKKERYRLLFLLSAPVYQIEEARDIIKLLFHTVNELCPDTVDRKCLQPYHLFYPGQKIILYRPSKIVSTDYIKTVFQEQQKPCISFYIPRVIQKITVLLKEKPFIPGITISADTQLPPAEYIITQVLHEIPKVFKRTVSINNGKDSILLWNNHKLCNTLLVLNRIIDYKISTYRDLECSNTKQEYHVLSVFEYYTQQLNCLLLCYFTVQNCTKKEAQNLLEQHMETVYSLLRIKVLPNKKMVMPSRLVQYANAVMDFSAYPNLQKIFQRDSRKQQLLAAILLCARDYYLQQTQYYVPKYELQQILPAKIIIQKLNKHFHVAIDRKVIHKWIKQFDELHLIHVCSDQEKGHKIQKISCYNPTVIQVPYFTLSVLQYADMLAADYKLPIKQATDNAYLTCYYMAQTLLDTYGYFTRSSFMQHCVEGAVFSRENAATYFDKYIRQIQQQMNLIRASCTRKLMTRFPGNHRIGSTKLYYQGET